MAQADIEESAVSKCNSAQQSGANQANVRLLGQALHSHINGNTHNVVDKFCYLGSVEQAMSNLMCKSELALVKHMLLLGDEKNVSWTTRDCDNHDQDENAFIPNCYCTIVKLGKLPIGTNNALTLPKSSLHPRGEV